MPIPKEYIYFYSITKIMNQLNYTTTLPDFITMQRASFCWFLTQGLSEELRFFSQILDFSQNTEYALYGEEYGLLKPPCTLAVARKYSGNYRAQLVIPIEVRNKKTNMSYLLLLLFVLNNQQ